MRPLLRSHSSLLDMYPDGDREWVKVGQPVRLPGIHRTAFGTMLMPMRSACTPPSSRFGGAKVERCNPVPPACALVATPTVASLVAGTGTRDG